MFKRINKTYTQNLGKCKTPDIDINQLKTSLDEIADADLPNICLIGNNMNLSLCGRDVSNDPSAVMSELGIQNGPKDTKICKLCIKALLTLNASQKPREGYFQTISVDDVKINYNIVE